MAAVPASISTALPSVGVERPLSRARGRWQRRHRSPDSGASAVAISRQARNSGSIDAFPISVPRQLFWMLSLLWQVLHSETSVICAP
jgi:hypothetical protein